MRRLRKMAVVIGLILVIVLVAGTAWGVVAVRSSFPTTEGTVAVPGLTANVKVRRDPYGVPTITADSAADLFFAQGYVHAQDRFWEIRGDTTPWPFGAAAVEAATDDLLTLTPAAE
jgi:penicillin G amidase